MSDKVDLTFSALLALLDSKLEKGWESFDINVIVADLLSEHSAIQDVTECIQAIKVTRRMSAKIDDPTLFENLLFSIINIYKEANTLVLAPAEVLTLGFSRLKSLRADLDVGPKVLAYIRTCFAKEGFLCYPLELKFAEEPTTEPAYEELKDLIRSKELNTEEFDLTDIVAVQAAKIASVQQFVQLNSDFL